MQANEPIVLPRPNLPPQPWTDGTEGRLYLFAGLIITLFVILVMEVIKRRRKRETKLGTPVDVLSPRSEPKFEATPDRVRQALLEMFGSGWRARTTEEVAAAPELVERFGPEVADRVIAYLRAVDRARFSGDTSAPSEELDWWASQFVEEATSRAAGTGAISSKIGK